MAVGRLDTFSIERVTSRDSAIEKSTTQVAATGEAIKSKVSEGSADIGVPGVGLYSDGRYLNDDNVVQAASQNVSGFIQGMVDGTGTKIDITG